MTTTASTTEAQTTKRVRYSAEGIYGEMLNFLIDEAAMLDDDRHLEWLDQLTDDVTYKMPYRQTVYRKDGDGADDRQCHFDDDRLSLGVRARRNVESVSALDRDPLPRIRRMVTNVVVYQGDSEDEYEVTSAILLIRNRFDKTFRELLSARRVDVIRRTPDGLRLARRVITVDQGTFGSSFVNVFM